MHSHTQVAQDLGMATPDPREADSLAPPISERWKMPRRGSGSSVGEQRKKETEEEGEEEMGQGL